MKHLTQKEVYKKASSLTKSTVESYICRRGRNALASRIDMVNFCERAFAEQSLLIVNRDTSGYCRNTTSEYISAAVGQQG